MDIYIPLAIYILVVSFYFQRKKVLLTILTFVPLFLFIGTRVGLGVDYDSYETRFSIQHDYDFATYVLANIDGKFEPGFFLLMKVAPDYNSFVFITSFIYVLSVAIFFYKLLPGRSYFLAFALWLFYPFFFESFVAMRSSLALSFFLLACCAKIDERKLLAVALVIISATFHMSGILLLIPILLPVRYIERHISGFATVFFVAAFLALSLPFVFSDSLKSLFRLSANFSDAYMSHITDTSYGVGFYLFSFVRLGFIVYIVFLLKKGVLKGWICWVAWVTILYYVLLMVQGISIMYRFCTYLFLITVVFKCYVIKLDRTIYSKIYLTLSIIYALYFFYGLTQNDVYERYFHHYHSFFFNF